MVRRQAVDPVAVRLEVRAAPHVAGPGARRQRDELLRIVRHRQQLDGHLVHRGVELRVLPLDLHPLRNHDGDGLQLHGRRLQLDLQDPDLTRIHAHAFFRARAVPDGLDPDVVGACGETAQPGGAVRVRGPAQQDLAVVEQLHGAAGDGVPAAVDPYEQHAALCRAAGRPERQCRAEQDQETDGRDPAGRNSHVRHGG